MPKKLRSPYFVSAELLPDGTVKLIDDDGEIFHVQMMRDDPWPMLSRQVRNLEMRETIAKKRDAPDKPAPTPPTPFKPRLIYPPEESK